MRARAKVLVVLSLLSAGSALATFACSNANGTFPSALPYYDPDGGSVPLPSEDSGADAATDGPSATDGGDAGAKGDAATDSGDSSVGDAATDSGDSGEPTDAADSG